MPHKSAPNDPLGGFSDIFNSLICCQSNDQPQQKRSLSRKPIDFRNPQQYSQKLSSIRHLPRHHNPDHLPAIYTQNFLTRQNSDSKTDSNQFSRSSSEVITPKMSLSLSEQKPLNPTTPTTSPSFSSKAIETSLTPSAMTFDDSQLRRQIQSPISAPNSQTAAPQAIEISSSPITTPIRVIGEMKM